MSIRLVEVNGVERVETIHRLNSRWPNDFYELEERHIRNGYWWLAMNGEYAVGFAGMVPHEPFPYVGYLKRAAVLPAYRGQGLQLEMIRVRERVARSIGWRRLVSECEAKNVHSANNFISAGYRLCQPERPWASTPSLYWFKDL